MNSSRQVALATLLCAALLASVSATTSAAAKNPSSQEQNADNPCGELDNSADSPALTNPETPKNPINPKIVSARPTIVKMGETIMVCTTSGFSEFMKKKDISKLYLLIDGRPFKRLPTIEGPADQHYVNFVMQLDGSNSDDWKSWAQVIDASRESGGQTSLTLTLSYGDDTFESPVFVTVDPYPKYWYLFVIAFIVLVSGLIALAAKTDLLRYTAEGTPTKPNHSPFSLGLVQMAFWFCLILAGYVYICVTSRQTNIPLGSSLGLLGISSSTGLAAVFVDKRKSDANSAKYESLKAEKVTLDERISESRKKPPDAGTNAFNDLSKSQARVVEITSLLKQLQPAISPPKSDGWLKDILADGDGVSFHRFQMAIWTIVLGVVFVWNVWRNMSMPIFDASLLTLMGISSGTYVGFKFPEKPKAAESGDAARTS